MGGKHTIYISPNVYLIPDGEWPLIRLPGSDGNPSEEIDLGPAPELAWMFRQDLDTVNSGDWLDVTYGNGAFVTVGMDTSNGLRALKLSSNGMDWVETNDENSNYLAVTYSPDLGMFMAVGSSGERIAVSTNGTTWVNPIFTLPDGYLPSNIILTNVIWADGRFITMGYINLPEDVHLVGTSTDGVNFTFTLLDLPTVPTLYNYWVSDVYYSNGIYVLLIFMPADGSGESRIYTSYNGVDWVYRQSVLDVELMSTAYGAGLFVVVGTRRDDTLNPTIYTSVDGASWIGRDTESPGDWSDVVWGGNNKFVAVSSTTNSPYAATSSLDGIVWTKHISPEPQSSWNSVSYGNGMYVAVAADAQNKSMFSFDGETWGSTWAPLPLATAYSITYVNGLYLVTTDNNDGILYYSTDLVNWLTKTSNNMDVDNPPVDLIPYVHTYGNGLYVGLSVGVPEVQGYYFVTSLDGLSWNIVTEYLHGYQSFVTRLEYLHGLYVALATGCISVSPDGNTWDEIEVTVDINATIYGLRANAAAYGAGLYVVVGDSWEWNDSVPLPPVLTSTDGQTWVPHTGIPGKDSWTGVAYGDGKFVAISSVGENQTMISYDGIEWFPHNNVLPTYVDTQTQVVSNLAWTNLRFINNMFVATCFDGLLYATSYNGLDWTYSEDPYIYPRPREGGANRWIDVIYDGTSYVMLASNWDSYVARIAYSPPPTPTFGEQPGGGGGGGMG